VVFANRRLSLTRPVFSNNPGGHLILAPD